MLLITAHLEIRSQKFFDVRARDPGRSTCTQEGPGYRRGLLYFQLLLPVCLALGVCAGCDAPKKYLYLTFRGAPAVFFRPDISPSMSDKAMSARLFSPPNRDDPALWKMSGRDRYSLPRGVGQHSRIFRGFGCISCNTVLQLPYNRKYSYPVQGTKKVICIYSSRTYSNGLRSVQAERHQPDSHP